MIALIAVPNGSTTRAALCNAAAGTSQTFDKDLIGKASPLESWREQLQGAATAMPLVSTSGGKESTHAFPPAKPEISSVVVTGLPTEKTSVPQGAAERFVESSQPGPVVISAGQFGLPYKAPLDTPAMEAKSALTTTDNSTPTEELSSHLPTVIETPQNLRSAGVQAASRHGRTTQTEPGAEAKGRTSQQITQVPVVKHSILPAMPVSVNPVSTDSPLVDTVSVLPVSVVALPDKLLSAIPLDTGSVATQPLSARRGRDIATPTLMRNGRSAQVEVVRSVASFQAALPKPAMPLEVSAAVDTPSSDRAVPQNAVAIQQEPAVRMNRLSADSFKKPKPAIEDGFLASNASLPTPANALKSEAKRTPAPTSSLDESRLTAVTAIENPVNATLQIPATSSPPPSPLAVADVSVSSATLSVKPLAKSADKALAVRPAGLAVLSQSDLKSAVLTTSVRPVPVATPVAPAGQHDMHLPAVFLPAPGPLPAAATPGITVPLVQSAPGIDHPSHALTALPTTPGLMSTLPDDGYAGKYGVEPTQLQALPGALEMGLHSETHGWVRVRAELDAGTGEVAAVVLTNTAHAAETLHRDLPAMQHYLTGEQITLSSLTVSQTGISGQREMQLNAGDGQREGGQSRQDAQGQSRHDVDVSEWNQDHAATDVPYLSGSGGWVNVIA